MRELTKIIRVKVGRFEEFPPEDGLLLKLAAVAVKNAQSPYSHYCVGAAVLSESGVIKLGCNVERCSWTQTTHAEQNAVDTMVTACGPVKITKVAIVSARAGTQISWPPKITGAEISLMENIPVPCGHCLQIIWENCFNDPDVKLIALADNGEVISTTMGDAFPMRFGPADLGVDYKKLLF